MFLNQVKDNQSGIKRRYKNFEWTDDYLIRRVRRVEKVKFKDLDNAHAWFEGYKHVDLLKHELQCIYPDMGNNTVLFQIKFKHPPESEKRL